MINTGILIFNEVEVLDFAGPFEVFSISENPHTKENLFNVFTIAQHSDSITARNGLKVIPDYTFSDFPDMDILIIPGGYGAEEIEIHNTVLLNWIKEADSRVKTIASICTGAFLLAESGVISSHEVTTHWMDIERLQRNYPGLRVAANRKFVDQGHVLTSGGISAGIELSLYIVSKYSSMKTAVNTAKRIEYDCDFSKFPE
ncbi:MAG: DJ-1/PfpI family protein [Spirochaetes bacterium]|nr:DJ-1/PfpI family protein [Spirochaetota bacterium]